jgi:hypothetical protein
MADLTGLGSVANLASNVIDKIWPNKSEQEKQEIQNAFLLINGQIDVNKAEAANPNWFVSGWRPFIGWICGTGLGYQFLVYPVLIAWQPKIVQLDMGTLITLLGGMLGLSISRTFEKVNNVAAK